MWCSWDWALLYWLYNSHETDQSFYVENNFMQFFSRSVDGVRLMATAVYKSSPAAMDQQPSLGHDFSITERGDSGELCCP
jgi:hypothetical protein